MQTANRSARVELGPESSEGVYRTLRIGFKSLDLGPQLRETSRMGKMEDTGVHMGEGQMNFALPQDVYPEI